MSEETVMVLLKNLVCFYMQTINNFTVNLLGICFFLWSSWKN